MGIKEKLNAMMKDEVSGVGEYGQLAKDVLKDKDVPEELRSTLSEVFKSIQADEDKHDKMLKFVAEELL